MKVARAASLMSGVLAVSIVVQAAIFTAFYLWVGSLRGTLLSLAVYLVVGASLYWYAYRQRRQRGR